MEWFFYYVCCLLWLLRCKWVTSSQSQGSCTTDPPCIGFQDEKKPAESPREFDMYVIPVTVSTLSIAQMEVEFDFYILLEETEISKKDDSVNRTVLPPAMEFRNCQKCTCVLDNVTLVVSGGKKATWKKRHFGRFYCDFDLSEFPMDTQQCFLQIVSNADKINLKRDQRLNNDFKTLIYWRLPEYDITESRPAGECEKLPMVLDTTHRPCVQYLLRFKRKLPYHVFNIYCPSFLVVVLSWISFWLDPEMTSPRVALGLTPLLTLTTQLANIQRSLPPVSYIKASDVWMSTCIILVFAALTELPIALHFHRKSQITQVAPATPLTVTGMKRNYCYTAKTTMVNRNPSIVGKIPYPREVNAVDGFCRVMFPIVFIIFTCAYWLYYMLYATKLNS